MEEKEFAIIVVREQAATIRVTAPSIGAAYDKVFNEADIPEDAWVPTETCRIHDIVEKTEYTKEQFDRLTLQAKRM